MKNGLHKIASALLLVFTLTACGLGAKPTATPVVDLATSPAVVLPTAQFSDPCANQYFPVKNNATYTYSSTGSPSGPYTFTSTVSNVRADGFTLTTRFKELELPQEWACKPEGLVAMQLGANDATSILAFEKFTDLSASNISGVILPVAITPGQEWAYALDIQGTEKPKNGAIPSTMTGRVASTYIVGKTESITVPAGTFDAIAIEVSTVIDFNVTNTGNTVSLTVDSTYTLWYAPGVGWVKSSGYGKLGGQEYFETIVLDSYNIP
jgi:hypothetical protein